MNDLPQEIMMPCCSGKSCGTVLYLDTIHPATAPGEPELAPLFVYRRGNDEMYSPRWGSLAYTRAWLAENEAAAC